MFLDSSENEILNCPGNESLVGCCSRQLTGVSLNIRHVSTKKTLKSSEEQRPIASHLLTETSVFVLPEELRNLRNDPREVKL